MSWDVMVFHLKGPAPSSLEQFQESDCQPLGTAAEVRQQISAKLGRVDWSDPHWGIYEEDPFSIEFNIGRQERVDNMMLHVRGGGDAVAALVRFARPLGWSVLDCSTGQFLDLDHPSQAGWDEFQAYRDKVLNDDNATQSEVE